MEQQYQLIELLVLLGGTLVLATFFGTYLARMISYENRPIEKTLAIVENRFYRLIGIDVSKQMTWKEYFFALFITNMIVVVIMIIILVFQNYLPLSNNVEGFSIDLAVNTAISFITNTNLQHYAGDQQLSNLSQMLAITFTMFVAPASGIAAAFAFIRSFIRKNFGLGNFYMDFIRIILTLLLPVSFVSALLLMVLGAPQTLDSSITVNPLESIINNNSTLTQEGQTLSIGPVASLESIKELGSNGGGFFGANSGHPFENPTGLSNLYEMFLMLIIPFSFPIAYAKLMGLGRGLSILVTMLIGFGILLSFSLTSENGPLLLETRFGSFGSALFDTSSLATNTGATNSGIAGMSSESVTAFFLAMFVQAIPGADGTGMMTMIVYVLLTLFIVGLMVGKTPEFMSMKISPRDIKLSMLIFLLHPAIILIPTVISFTTGNAQAIVGEPVTAMGFTQTLYEYTSAAANNGSDYFGTSADTPFWNWTTTIVMFLGRYVPIGLMLAIAGSFTIKDRKEVIEPIKTKGPLFISILVVMTFLLTALSFFPFLIMGPGSI
ncbi:MAG: potassium-transporting ATPase subunit KdpA [Nitrososphaeraceae archaeon]